MNKRINRKRLEAALEVVGFALGIDNDSRPEAEARYELIVMDDEAVVFPGLFLGVTFDLTNPWSYRFDLVMLCGIALNVADHRRALIERAAARKVDAALQLIGADQPASLADLADDLAEQPPSIKRGRVPTSLTIPDWIVEAMNELADELERQGLAASQVHRLIREYLISGLENHVENMQEMEIEEPAQEIIDNECSPSWYPLGFLVTSEYEERAHLGLLPPLRLTFEQVRVALTMCDEIDALPVRNEHPIDTLVRFIAAVNAGEVDLPTDGMDRLLPGADRHPELDTWINVWWTRRYPAPAKNSDDQASASDEE